MAEPLHYRKLRVYKYQLMQDYAVRIPLQPIKDIDTSFLQLSQNGDLWISQRYAWDGPSGPTIDTHTFMRGSLVHDALYQLMRERHLDHRQDRRIADAILRQHCVEDGMAAWRAWYVYHSVRLFGEKAAAPGAEEPDEIFIAPRR